MLARDQLQVEEMNSKFSWDEGPALEIWIELSAAIFFSIYQLMIQFQWHSPRIL